MNCAQATELVEKKRDAKLSIWDRIGLRIHILTCTLCALFFKQSKLIDDSFKAYAGKVDDGQKTYPLDPHRKAEIHSQLQSELQKS